MTDPWSSILAYIWINILARWSDTDCIIRSCLRKVFVLSLMLVTKSWWDFLHLGDLFLRCWSLCQKMEFVVDKNSRICFKHLQVVFNICFCKFLNIASLCGYRLVIDISTKKIYDRNKHTAFDIENCYFGHWNTAWCWKLLQGCKKGCFGNFLILKNFDDL